jgi:hypothetical protein
MSIEDMDFSKFINPEMVDEEVQRHRDTVCKKVKLQEQTKQQKKDSNSSFNEVIKSLQEEITEELEIIDQLMIKKRELKV